MNDANTPPAAQPGPEREVLLTVGHSKLIVSLLILASLMIAALAYGWLSIPDARTWQFAGTVLLGMVLIVFLFLWHVFAVGFVFRGVVGFARRGWEANLRAVFLLVGMALAWALSAALMLWGISCANDAVPALSDWLASWLTNALRRPVAPAAAEVALGGLPWLAAWLLFAILWLPLSTRMLFRSAGSASLRGTLRAWRSVRYWCVTALVFIVGLWLPWQLATWVPEVQGLWLETLSWVLRVGVAYVVAVLAWLFLLGYAERVTTGNESLPPPPAGIPVEAGPAPSSREAGAVARS